MNAAERRTLRWAGALTSVIGGGDYVCYAVGKLDKSIAECAHLVPAARCLTGGTSMLLATTIPIAVLLGIIGLGASVFLPDRGIDYAATRLKRMLPGQGPGGPRGMSPP